MDRIKALREERDVLASKVEALTILAQEEEREFTEEEQAEIDAIIGDEEAEGELAQVSAKIKKAERLDEIRRDIAASRAAQTIVPKEAKVPGEVNMKGVVIPAKARSRSQVKSFQGPDAEKEAYLSGLFYQAAFTGNKEAKNKLQGHGIQMAQQGGDDSLGGYLVPDILETSLIRLVEQYGVARQECRVLPMGVGGTFSIPRRIGGYTSYFVDELADGTASDLTFDQINLVAKKLMILSSWSSELTEDSAVALGDTITQEIAYSFAQKEDDCLFNGDGTAGYGTIDGLASALLAGSVVATATGVTSLADVTMATFEEAVGKLPQYAGIRPKWYCHSSVWANTLQRLAMAAGGNTVMNYENGVGPSFLGYPVVLSQVMAAGGPDTDLASTDFCYFGDMGMTATLGDKRGVTVATDSSLYFTSDAIALRATERFDINVHEVGAADAAGSMLALQMAAS